MDRDQYLLGDDQASIGSAESVPGGFIPPVQGAGLHAEQQVYMSAEEEVRQTLHVWRGAAMPAQTAVTVEDVQELSRDAQRVLQDTAASTAAEIAKLTQETGETFGRVEDAFGDMDSRVESMGQTVERLRDQQNEQLQRTQANLQSTVALEQRLMQAEQQRTEEAAQHAVQLREQRQHVQYLEGVIKTEVQAHKQANAALRVANEGQVKLKGEVQDLSVQLQAALDQIQKLSVDLATTRSLFDTGAGGRPFPQQPPQQQQQQKVDDGAGPSTSTRKKKPKLDAQKKGKKTPSLVGSDAPSVTGRGKAPSRSRSLSLLDTDNDGPRYSSSSSEDGSRDVPRSWRFLRQRKGRQDCEDDKGCGSDAPAAQVRFDIKPKDPPVFTGKATDDVEVWVRQVENYLQLLGGSDAMQVSYVGTLLQGTAQLWFQRECSAGRRPGTWEELAESLCGRFRNDTKADQAQSALMSIRQGKNETAHDFSLRFEAVLDKIPAYDETWVRNLFVWGLHAGLAQQVNMKNPTTLNRAMQLAKRADVAMAMSRRPGQREVDSQQKKTDGAQASGSGGFKKGYFKNWKQNKNQSGQPGASGGQPQRTGNFSQGNWSGNPQFRGGRGHPAPTRNTGPGPRTSGPGNQRRTRFALVHPQDQQEPEVVADQQGQESAQQADRTDPAASRNQSSGN